MIPLLLFRDRRLFAITLFFLARDKHVLGGLCSGIFVALALSRMAATIPDNKACSLMD